MESVADSPKAQDNSVASDSVEGSRNQSASSKSPPNVALRHTTNSAYAETANSRLENHSRTECARAPESPTATPTSRKIAPAWPKPTVALAAPARTGPPTTQMMEVSATTISLGLVVESTILRALTFAARRAGRRRDQRRAKSVALRRAVRHSPALWMPIGPEEHHTPMRSRQKGWRES